MISGAVNDADLITDYRFSSIDLGNKALEKFKDQTLSDKQIERHGSLTRVEELKPEDFE